MLFTLLAIELLFTLLAGELDTTGRLLAIELGGTILVLLAAMLELLTTDILLTGSGAVLAFERELVIALLARELLLLLLAITELLIKELEAMLERILLEALPTGGVDPLPPPPHAERIVLMHAIKVILLYIMVNLRIIRRRKHIGLSTEPSLAPKSPDHHTTSYARK